MSYSYITNWLPKEDAQAMVKSLISEGKFKKGEIKLSSYRWADLNDHSKGYVARVHVLTGLHPDMELGLCGRKKRVQKTEAEPVEEVLAEPVEEVLAEPVEEVETEEVELTKTKIQFHGCLQDGEHVQVIEVEADMTSEQIELLQNDPEGQGQEIALSLAEDINIDEFNHYTLAA